MREITVAVVRATSSRVNVKVRLGDGQHCLLERTVHVTNIDGREVDQYLAVELLVAVQDAVEAWERRTALF